MVDFNENTERLLLANDSSVTSVGFDSMWSSRLAPSRLGTALQGNTHVTVLDLNLEYSDEGDDFNGTIQFIEESASLECLSVSDGGVHLASLMGQLLHAAVSNPSITKYSFYETAILANDLASLLQASLIEDLDLWCCDLLRGEMPSDEAAVELITEAFASNTSLQKLGLGQGMTATMGRSVERTMGRFVQGILQTLPGHSKLQCLKIDNITEPGVNTMLLASSTCPLKELEFQHCGFTTIAGCLRSSAKVSRISFGGYTFDEASSLLLASIFRSSGCVKELVLKDWVKFPDNTNVLGSLIESSSHLSVLDLTAYVRSLDDSSNGLEAILSGLKATTSKVEELLLPRLTPAQCALLLASLPAFRGLKRLECILDEPSECLKDRLLEAFYLNGSIIDSDGVQAHFLDETDRTKLRLYASRNETLAPTIKSTIVTATTTNSSEINLVPRLLRLSLTATSAAGLSDVFFALAHLNDRIGSSNNGKRSPEKTSLTRND